MTPLTDAQIAVLGPYADTLIAAATQANLAPAAFATVFGTAGCSLITARKLQADAAVLRAQTLAAATTNEARAQALEAQATAIESALSSHVTA